MTVPGRWRRQEGTVGAPQCLPNFTASGVVKCPFPCAQLISFCSTFSATVFPLSEYNNKQLQCSSKFALHACHRQWGREGSTQSFPPFFNKLPPVPLTSSASHSLQGWRASISMLVQICIGRSASDCDFPEISPLCNCICSASNRSASHH